MNHRDNDPTFDARYDRREGLLRISQREREEAERDLNAVQKVLALIKGGEWLDGPVPPVGETRH